jgi:hypothetical protein
VNKGTLWDVIKVLGTFFIEMEEAVRNLERLSEPIAPTVLNLPIIAPTTGFGTGLLLGSSAAPQPSTPAPPAEGAPSQPAFRFVEMVRAQLDRVERLATGLRLKRTLSRVGYIRAYLETAEAEINAWRDQELWRELRVLRQSFRDDLDEQPVLLPDVARSSWYNHAQPFGQKVHDAFPRIRFDIMEAGNCYACDNPTACVFHLMRVVEHAIRLLARQLKVKGLKSELEFEDFRKIHDRLKEKLQELRNSKRGKSRQEEIDFYSDVADRCQSFKEMWRDAVMHSRQNYDTNEAASILTRVSELMQRLAERLSESA